MYENIFSLELPVGERLKLVRNRLQPEESKDFNNLNRISIVTGIHGDEMEGQYICYELIRRIEADIKHLTGIVDIYPAVNMLGLDNAIHTIPKERLDMNHIFPGSEKGTMMERIAYSLTENIIGSSICIDIHGSDIFSRESLQVRLNEDFANQVIPYAKLINANLIWTNPNPTVSDSTLTHSMNCLGVPAFAVECGVGNTINKKDGDTIVDGIFNVMSEFGIWSGETYLVSEIPVCDDSGVDFIRADKAGLFVSEITDFANVKKGQIIGRIVDVMNNKVLQEVNAPHYGMLFTIREFPMVYEGALLARILIKDENGEEKAYE